MHEPVNLLVCTCAFHFCHCKRGTCGEWVCCTCSNLPFVCQRDVDHTLPTPRRIALRRRVVCLSSSSCNVRSWDEDLWQSWSEDGWKVRSMDVETPLNVELVQLVQSTRLLAVPLCQSSERPSLKRTRKRCREWSVTIHADGVLASNGKK